VVLPLATGEKVDLDAAGRLLLSPGGTGQAAGKNQANAGDPSSIHRVAPVDEPGTTSRSALAYLVFDAAGRSISQP